MLTRATDTEYRGCAWHPKGKELYTPIAHCLGLLLLASCLLLTSIRCAA
jgi:hypothetical protein